MRFPPDIQKLEREKRLKKRQEIRKLTRPLRIKRRKKPPVSTRPRTLLESMERRLAERGEVLLEGSTKQPNNPPELMERRPEERGEASSSSSVVEMVQIEVATLENTSSMINQGLAIVMGHNSYASVANILQRDLRIDLGEASIWSRLDDLG